MAKPYILALDDDPAVLRAVERDLKSQFGPDYRILAVDSPEKAIGFVRQLTSRGDRIALFVVDQRMPGMSGTEFLREALPMQPDARRVLLTAYADSNAAIDAINKVRLNHYLMKPCRKPPEQNLFPVLVDLLEDWNAGNSATFEGTYIVGARWNPETHRLKDFLAKSQIPYRWIEPGSVVDPRIDAALGTAPRSLPAVIFPDGTVLERPDTSALAAKLGLLTSPSRDFYDVVVIGAGPAGLACALYCSTEGLRTVLVEREAAGGQAGLSSRIENYLGFPSGLSGADLARRGVAQVKRFGTEVLAPARAVKLTADGEYRIVTLDNGKELAAHSVVIASGVQWRRLDIPGVEELTGAGVYYGAATTEAMSCQDEDVYIVGGANSAGQAAVHFSGFARSVTMLVRADSLSKSMSHYLSREDQGNRQHRGDAAFGSRESRRQRPPRKDSYPPSRHQGNRRARRASAIHLHRRGAAYGMAGRHAGPRQQGFPAHRPESHEGEQATARLDVETRSLSAGDECSRSVRGGRRARRRGAARSEQCGRRLHCAVLCPPAHVESLIWKLIWKMSWKTPALR